MPDTECYQLFVYGSLRKGFQHPAYNYISKYFDLVGHAKVNGILYDLGNYPAAKPTSLPEQFIFGELYVIKNIPEFDWAIAQLDDYEGTFPEEGPALFIRQIAEIELENTKTTAWMYWYNLDTSHGTPVPSGDVLDYFRNKANP